LSSLSAGLWCSASVGANRPGAPAALRLGGHTCAFSGGNPKRRYDRLARRLPAEPAQLPDDQGGTVPFTYADLVSTTLGVLYDPSSWPPSAEFLQELDTLCEG
jgi:hypothetical protein